MLLLRLILRLLGLILRLLRLILLGRLCLRLRLLRAGADATFRQGAAAFCAETCHMNFLLLIRRKFPPGDYFHYKQSLRGCQSDCRKIVLCNH